MRGDRRAIDGRAWLLAAGFSASAIMGAIPPGDSTASTAPPPAISGASAGEDNARNMELLGRLDTRPGFKNIWGYTAPGGTELALIGTQQGTQIVDVTEPDTPVEIAFFDGTLSNWRELRTYGHYLYIVNDTLSDNALQIVDLSDPLAPRLVYSGSEFFRRAHTVFIDEDAGVLYAAGAARTAQGYVALDLANPETPALLGTFEGNYLHDLYVRDGILYGAAMFDAHLLLLDVSSPGAPVVLSRVPYIGAFPHNTWLTDDGRYCLVTDETAGGHIHVFDVTDPRNPEEVAEWFHPEKPGSSVHNVHTRGSIAYVAWYTEGVVLLDVSDPAFPQRLAFYDTYPGSEQVLFDGVWGVYPYLASGNILASDMSTGLYVFRYLPNHARVPITVRNDSGGEPLAGVSLTFPDEEVDPGRTGLTDETGRLERVLSPGVQRVEASLFGFEDVTESLEAMADRVQPLEIRMRRVPTGSISGEITSSSGPIADAQVRVAGAPLSVRTDEAGRFELPNVPVNSWSLEVERFGYRPEVLDSIDVRAGLSTDLDLELVPSVYADDFETNEGWIVGDPADTATRGIWERVDPLEGGLGVTQPGDDHSLIGTTAFITENGAAGDAIAIHDVDDGVTTLLSPRIDLSGVVAPVVEYARWFYNSDSANPSGDELLVEFSRNDGVTWDVLERVVEDTGNWTRATFRLDCAGEPSAFGRLRFRVRDEEPASVVEAGIDDVQIYTASPEDDPLTCALESALVELGPSVPNPFRFSTLLTFRIGTPNAVRLGIYDVAGRRLRSVIDADLGIGEHRVAWDGTDDRGERVPSGVYWVRLDAGGRELARRIVQHR